MNKKGIFIIGCLSTSIIGYIILIVVENVKVKIFGTCLITTGLYPSVILLVAWLSINTGGYTKRATIWAGCEIFSQCLSIMGTHVYDTPPKYVKGHSIMIAFLALSIACTAAIMSTISRSNARKDRVEAVHIARGDLELHPHITQTLEDVHDNHILFRYII